MVYLYRLLNTKPFRGSIVFVPDVAQALLVMNIRPIHVLAAEHLHRQLPQPFHTTAEPSCNCTYMWHRDSDGVATSAAGCHVRSLVLETHFFSANDFFSAYYIVPLPQCCGMQGGCTCRWLFPLEGPCVGSRTSGSASHFLELRVFCLN